MMAGVAPRLWNARDREGADHPGCISPQENCSAYSSIRMRARTREWRPVETLVSDTALDKQSPFKTITCFLEPS